MLAIVGDDLLGVAVHNLLGVVVRDLLGVVVAFCDSCSRWSPLAT